MIPMSNYDYRSKVEEALAEIGKRRKYIAKLKAEGAFDYDIEHQQYILDEQRLRWLRYNLDMAVKEKQMTEEERQEVIRKDREAQRGQN